MTSPMAIPVVIRSFLFALLSFPPAAGAAAFFNVRSFGASAGGTIDSAGAFLNAWYNACRSRAPATIYVPAGRYFVTRAAFIGPCRNSQIKFLIDGTISAPSDYRSASKEWISFNGVNGVSISGGRLDGAGSRLWACKLSGGQNCPAGSGASSLTFSGSKNIAIDGLTSMNSELFHIVFLHCENVNVRRVNIRAPATSPNTDGIHVQMSSGVEIMQTNIRTGDDCVSVGPGTAHLWIERVFCGPGHGISIGSLGKQGDVSQAESVRNVTVKTVIFSGTQNGVRIKTWGTNTPGQVKQVVFEDVLMRDVQNPIIIDQNYCPGNKGCPGKDSAIRISEVEYKNIQGTSATPVAVSFDCSRRNPCSGITLQDIKLSYQAKDSGLSLSSSCKFANGAASGVVRPPSCL